jgi:hypothetical protein
MLKSQLLDEDIIQFSNINIQTQGVIHKVDLKIQEVDYCKGEVENKDKWTCLKCT